MTQERKPKRRTRPAPEMRLATKDELRAAAKHAKRDESGAEAKATIDLGLAQDRPESERIAKRIARAGLASRRDAEKMIAEGRVRLDGTVVTSPALDVRPEQVILIDGERLPDPDRVRLFRYHKTAGVLVSARDPQGRRTIYEHIPAGLPRLQPIGRLDMNTEGLLLLTNDGELKRKMELPSSGLTRHYRARAFGNLTPQSVAALKRGITIDGIEYGAIEVEEERRTGANLWLRVSLSEGKNREIRKVLEHLGLKVNRLIRIGYGPFVLGQLPRQAVAEVSQKVLSEALGIGRKGERKIGTAKAKPRPVRPRSRVKAKAAQAAKTATTKTAGGGTAKPTNQPTAKPSTKGGRGANRRG